MKIAAFNIQRFGKNKLSDPDVLQTLVKVTPQRTFLFLLKAGVQQRSSSMKLFHEQAMIQKVVCAPQIVSRYDIILILEVVDISGEAVKTFLEALNTFVSA